MNRSRFSEERVAYALRQAGSETPVADVCRRLGVSDATFCILKEQYTRLGVSKPRRMRDACPET